ncbi:MAG: cob(I)yrinic acid a,c-diamide adenosyltransferase [bacterium]|nr:cob(I)yrinic acid a,c-diamide adenosyltransferase [bacterium]
MQTTPRGRFFKKLWYSVLMLYTRKGDKGTTKFFDTKSGERVSKNSGTAEALGFLDELNSFLGLCKVKSEGSGVVVGSKKISIHEALENIQQNLFIVQAEVAGDKEKKITQEKITEIEEIIDTIEKEIPKITSFTIVGGSELSALLDVARTIARRTERSLVGVCESGEREVCDSTRAYVNRLSSLLFALARFVNFKSGIKEKSPHYK